MEKENQRTRNYKIKKIGNLSKAKMRELIVTFREDLIVVDPHVAISGQNIDMRFRFPVGVSLAAVRVAEGDVHARKFLVLQKNADH